MAKTKILKVGVEPKVLKWLIGSSGWDETELMNSLRVSENTFKGWLSGTVEPTINQLKKLANLLKRPLAAFLLSEPQAESPLPKDYRVISTEKKGEFDKKTILAIRKARILQHLTQELSANINETLKPKVKKYNLNENPKDVAIYFRNEVFNLSEEKQTKFKSDYNFCGYLREKIEELNIIPFQISMPIKDARGFALVDEILNVVVVSSQDEIRPRIFSLLHEFAHVLLGESGVSIPDFTMVVNDKVEKWCNSFASEFLLPEAIAKYVFDADKASLVETKTLTKIANRFAVSKAMVLYNMHSLGYISKSTYNDVLNRPQKEKKVGKGGGGVPAETKCLSEMGKKFVSLVADNYDKGFITYADALSYLSVKSSKMKKVLAKATK